jgi:hypothetical protein
MRGFFIVEIISASSLIISSTMFSWVMHLLNSCLAENFRYLNKLCEAVQAKRFDKHSSFNYHQQRVTSFTLPPHPNPLPQGEKEKLNKTSIKQDGCFVRLIFEVGICFGFRYSDFGFLLCILHHQLVVLEKNKR